MLELIGTLIQWIGAIIAIVVVCSIWAGMGLVVVSDIYDLVLERRSNKEIEKFWNDIEEYRNEFA